MEDLISIIIPVYNHTEHLQEVLAALSRQSYQNFEVIIVDDGSMVPVESTRFTLPNNSEILWFRQENKGAPAARNFGITQSHGEYVLFLDADVIASPEMLEKLALALENNLSAQYSYCDHYFGAKRFLSKAFNAQSLKKNNYITTMSLIRRKNFPGFDESLKRFQDWDLWLTLLDHGHEGIYVPGFFFRVLPHRGGISDALPRYAYRFPFCYLPGFFGKVRVYNKAKKIVQLKHHLI